MNTSNQKVTFKGDSVAIGGRELKIGDSLPAFKLTANDLSDLESTSFDGKALIVCSVPSVDTPVCDTEIRKFNEEAANLSDDVVVLVVSQDLPFAQKRWCGAAGIEKVQTASDYKYRAFGEDFGVVWQGPQLLARGVFVSDKEGKLVHVEYVEDIATEPNYEAALSAAKEVA